MNKKFLSLALTGLFAFGTLFGAAACKPKEDVNSGNGGTNNGNTNNGGGTVKPGTVISDETLKGSLFAALAETDLTGLTFTGSVNMNVTQGGESKAQKLSLEGAAQFGKQAQGDLYLTSEGGEAPFYLLGFLRGEDLYSAMGEKDEKSDLTALKAQLKAENDPLVLEKKSESIAQTVLSSPAALKLVKNATSLFEGVVVKTEGGYSLEFDLFDGVDGLLESVEAVAQTIEDTAEITLTGLFSQNFISDTLDTLLNGITAKELDGLLTLLPEEIAQSLPETANGTAKEYLLGLLRSGDFYTAITGGDEPWTDYRTFGEVPLSALVSAFTGEETDFKALGLKNMIKEFRENLEKQVMAELLELLSVPGTVSDEETDLSLSFAFDDDKKLLGFSVDALAECNVSEGETEQQPDGGTSPEDGGGDPMTAGEPIAKARFAAKIAATCAKAPDLFSLSGCKYSDGEGGTQTIA